jgi:membrane protease subunit (stomatin/prohibitin family)
LPGRYDELSEGLMKRLEEDFSHYGLGLTHLYISSITPPLEVQQAIDDKSRLGVFDDLNQLIKMKAAMAVEKVSEQQGAAGAGIGMGMGFMMPAMFADMMKGSGSAPPAEKKEELKCPDCKNPVTKDVKFCPSCGHQLLVFQQCTECGKNLPPSARFCSRCGTKVDSGTRVKKCSHCGADNLKESVFCNQCGERL